MMLPLIETIIGISVIMMILSFLIKSLSSVVKNHVEYYSKNLKSEFLKLVKGTVGGNWAQWTTDYPELNAINWKGLSEEYLTKDNMEWVLKKLKATPVQLLNLEGRLDVHRANLSYAFEKRTKNIALALGVGFCLLMNVNAFTIWDTLYHNEEIRAKFASQTYVESVETRLKDYEENFKKLENQEGMEADKEKKNIEKQRQAWQKQLDHFRGEVSFGVGRIWTDDINWLPDFFYEFFGSLFTGILISIGAPYWHDIIRALGGIRKKPTK